MGASVPQMPHSEADNDDTDDAREANSLSTHKHDTCDKHNTLGFTNYTTNTETQQWAPPLLSALWSPSLGPNGLNKHGHNAHGGEYESQFNLDVYKPHYNNRSEYLGS